MIAIRDTQLFEELKDGKIDRQSKEMGTGLPDKIQAPPSPINKSMGNIVPRIPQNALILAEIYSPFKFTIVSVQKIKRMTVTKNPLL